MRRSRQRRWHRRGGILEALPVGAEGQDGQWGLEALEDLGRSPPEGRLLNARALAALRDGLEI